MESAPSRLRLPAESENVPDLTEIPLLLLPSCAGVKVAAYEVGDAALQFDREPPVRETSFWLKSAEASEREKLIVAVWSVRRDERLVDS